MHKDARVFITASGDLARGPDLVRRIAETADVSGAVYIHHAEHDRRVTELLAANNALVERARQAEAQLRRAEAINEALNDAIGTLAAVKKAAVNVQSLDQNC